ncbi:MAG: hypothetical protein E6R03_15290 [Hyphomicrobiaceae bacterium]|nr:MAG: hypothetical protein E6R03_15290 [Hyphomicrobiaceae bacterium]
MPSPSSSLTTLRPDLTGSLQEYSTMMNRESFIGLRVAPVFESGKSSGTFGRIPLEQLLQSRDTERAPGSGYSRGNWSFTQDTYATSEHGAEEPIDDNEAVNYREYFDAELVGTERALDAVLSNHEKRVADLIFNASTWTGTSLTTAISNEWDDFTSATPITDVEAAVRKVWSNSGIWPNSLIINRHVFRNLRQCSQVKDAIASSGAGDRTTLSDINIEALKRVFDLQNIFVAGGAENTAAEGQSATIGKIWSDEYAMVCYIDDSNDLRRPTLARTFHWSEDGSQIGGLVESYRDESKRSNIIRVRQQVGLKVMYVECGHLLSNVTT